MVDDKARLERLSLVHTLENSQKPINGFIVGRVNAERPFIGGQQFNDLFEFFFHDRSRIRPWFEEILKISGRPGKVLARAIHAQPIIARTGLGDPNPLLVVVQLLPGRLGKKVVGNAKRHLAFVVKLPHNVIIFRVVLPTTTSVNDRSNAKTIQFAHEVTGGIDLVFDRQFWPLRQGRIEDQRRWACDQHARRIAICITLNFAARRVWCVLVHAEGLQGGTVQQGAGIEVKYENWCVRSSLVDLIERRHPSLFELKLRPAAHNAHPLRRRGVIGLLAQHGQCIRNRRRVLPSQFHIVAETTPDQMGVTVIQSWNDTFSSEVDRLRGGRTVAHDVFVTACCNDLAVFDGNCCGVRSVGVERRNAPVI